MIVSKIEFPQFTGIKCTMMPFIQGDSKSLPDIYQPYADIIDNMYLENGDIGYLTIDESYVLANSSQRGYNSIGIDRNVHIEVGIHQDIYAWGGGGTSTGWGRSRKTLLNKNTKVLIANSISNTCRLWDKLHMKPTNDGDLSEYITEYPIHEGLLMKAGEVANISIFTPHECVNQLISGNRQFIRIVGNGVTGREEYFTVNPLLQ